MNINQNVPLVYAILSHIFYVYCYQGQNQSRGTDWFQGSRLLTVQNFIVGHVIVNLQARARFTEDIHKGNKKAQGNLTQI